MFPLDPMFLIFLKFFIVVTCIVFWLRLAMRYLAHGYRVDGRRYHRRSNRYEDEDDENAGPLP